MRPLEPGSPAPDFTLPRKIGEPPFRLADHRGRHVVVFFYPLAFSGVCTREVCQVAEDWDQWTALNAVVVGISTDSAFVNHRFAQETGAPFPLLSDFNRDTMTAYGVRNDDYFGMRGVADRSVFVIDPEGVIRYSWVAEDDSILPDFDAVRSAIEG